MQVVHSFIYFWAVEVDKVHQNGDEIQQVAYENLADKSNLDDMKIESPKEKGDKNNEGFDEVFFFPLYLEFDLINCNV